MNDIKTDWYLQEAKHFSYHMTVVSNLDNTELHGFFKQIFSEQEVKLSPPSHLYVILPEEKH